MTDDEILDECRKSYARCAAMEIPQKTIEQILYEAQTHVQEAANLQNIWNNYANIHYGISDTGDETSPSESNPVPIEDVYAPEETEEEKQLRMWRALQAAAQG